MGEMCVGSPASSIVRIFPFSKKLHTRREAVHVRRRQDRHPICLQQTPDVAQESDWTFYVLDDLDGNYQVEAAFAELDRKIGLVEVRLRERHIGLERLGPAVRGTHVPPSLPEPRGKRPGAGAEIDGAPTGPAIRRKDFLEHEIMQARVRCCRQHARVPDTILR